jgi:hypothetical protein
MSHKITVLQQFSPQKSKAVISQLRSSPELLEFLLWYNSRVIENNTFIDEWTIEKRALADGRAKAAKDLNDLLKGIAE